MCLNRNIISNRNRRCKLWNRYSSYQRLDKCTRIWFTLFINRSYSIWNHICIFSQTHTHMVNNCGSECNWEIWWLNMQVLKHVHLTWNANILICNNNGSHLPLLMLTQEKQEAKGKVRNFQLLTCFCNSSFVETWCSSSPVWMFLKYTWICPLTVFPTWLVTSRSSCFYFQLCIRDFHVFVLSQ